MSIGKKYEIGYDRTMDPSTQQQYPREYSGYTLLESIGKGGMSAIDLAQTTVSDAQYVRFVVIKRIHTHLSESDDSYIRMFQDEARISAELQHANIAQVYNFGQFENEFFMVMEYVPGLDLRELQRGLAAQGKGIPIRITLKILYDVLQALDYAHHRVDTFGKSLNIVHRDVNPRNVMLSIRGEVKLIDFGVAKADNRMDKTVGHTIKGKFAYMAPEQIDPTIGDIDGRADLFAVGLMLFELVAGQRPFQGLNEIQIMHKIMSVDIPDLPRAQDHPKPEMLQAIFNMVTRKEPSQRYTSAGQMAMAIQQASMSVGGMANTGEMANFLRVNMPQKVDTISTRLSNYKSNATMNSGVFNTIAPIQYVDELTPSIGTLQQSPKTTDSTDGPVQNQPASSHRNSRPSYGPLIGGGVLIFALGFGGIVYFGSVSDTPQPSPTQRISPTQKTVTKDTVPSDKEGTTNRTTKPVRSPENASATKQFTPPPNSTAQQTKTKSVSNQKSSQKEASKQSRDAKANKATNTTQKSSVAKDSRLQNQKETVPVEPVITESKENKEHKEVSKTDKTTTETQEIKTHTLYLMVGVESGTRGLPVYYRNVEITKTGAKKSVTLPLGEVKLEIRDPTTNMSVFQTITVESGDPILTVQVHRL